jgi:Acyltransferase family
VAVVGVLLYHGGVSWDQGGFLGVEMFFVLSGFLITSLLVSEWADSATVVLRAFWARRARRLLPALFAVVLAIGVYYALAGATKAVPGLQSDGISTLLYFSNWHQIAAGTNYFAATGPVSPLQHTWSLAIEEQFYLLWPLLVLAVLRLARRAGASPRRSLQVLLGLLALDGAVVVLILAVVVAPGSPGARLLALAPLRGVGQISYGLYLWHFPSLAFTLGVPMMDNEQNYGVQLANAAKLGCAFTTTGQLDVNGTWESPPTGCPSALSQWARDEKKLRAQEVVVELGYRDEFNWRQNSKLVHLGQPAFDAQVQSRINRYVQVLGRGGVKILFLLVPFTHPPDESDGAPAPASSPARHSMINAMLTKETRLHPQTVQVLNLDTTVSPGDHYDPKVDGQLCRFDGIHFSVFCAKLVEPRVLGEARKLLGS